MFHVKQLKETRCFLLSRPLALYFFAKPCPMHCCTPVKTEHSPFNHDFLPINRTFCFKNSFFASKLRFCSLIISFSLQTTNNLACFIQIYTKHEYYFVLHQRASNTSALSSFESTQFLPSFKSLRLAYAIPPLIYAVFHVIMFHVKHWCKHKSASLASKLLLKSQYHCLLLFLQ